MRIDLQDSRSTRKTGAADICAAGASVSGRMRHPIAIPFAKIILYRPVETKIFAGNISFKQNSHCINASSGYFSIWKR